MSPKRSQAHLTVAFVELFCSGESLLLAPTRACPPTVRPNDATTASLLAPSEDSFSFPTFFTRLTSASTIPALAHPLEWACPLSVRLQSLFCRFTSLLLIGLSTSLRVFLRLLSPVLIFPELQATFLSHWATYGATVTNTSGSFNDHPSSAFCLYILSRSRTRLHRWFPTLSCNWSSCYVTKSVALNRSFC